MDRTTKLRGHLMFLITSHQFVVCLCLKRLCLAQMVRVGVHYTCRGWLSVSLPRFFTHSRFTVVLPPKASLQKSVLLFSQARQNGSMKRD